MGYINKKGEMIIPPTFLLAKEFTSGVARVSLGAEDGYAVRVIDSKGRFLDSK